MILFCYVFSFLDFFSGCFQRGCIVLAESPTAGYLSEDTDMDQNSRAFWNHFSLLVVFIASKLSVKRLPGSAFGLF